MVDPISLTIAIVSVIGTIIIAVIQLMQTHDIKSSCCVFGDVQQE